MRAPHSPAALVMTVILALLLASPAMAEDEDATGGPMMPGHEPAVAAEPDEDADERPLPLKELRKFTEVFERIKQAYVEEISDQELLEKAIRGMLSGLDPHSSYLEPDAFSQLEEDTSGEFGGLGMEVDMGDDGFIRVIAPIDNTPAYEAGIQPGDRIMKIDESPVKGMSLEDAIGKMRGEPGTKVTLTIMRDDDSGPQEIELERAVIKTSSVRGEMLDRGYAYVRIANFSSSTGDDFISKIDALREEHGNKLDGLILDLRNNPGGVLQTAVEVSDAMLDEGLIVYTEGRIENSKMQFHASEGDKLEGVPIIVLINAGSASASEIVAGALQDHGRAVVLGTDSFGKGSVQTVMPLGDSHGVKLTTARYFTPEGRSIQAKGIRPDIIVRQARLQDVETTERFTESDLSGHLGPGGDDDERDRARELELSERLEGDYQLRSAINLLKGMSIFDQRRQQNTQQPELD